jgi:DNA-binding MarR family transcriptional regulator
VTGRKPETSDKEILKEVALSPDPIVTAPELAERMDYTRQGVNNRLNDLAEKGYLERRDVGSRATVYWITEKGRELLAER